LNALQHGHNVAIPHGRTAGHGAASISRAAVRRSTHDWTIKDAVYGVPHTRDVHIHHDARRIRVADSFPTASRWEQRWHLDPAWTLASGGADARRLVFAHPSGHRLTVTTTGRTASITRGRARPPAGWHFPDAHTRTPAAEIVIRSSGDPLTTTFQVS
jgi:hypothetical protein